MKIQTRTRLYGEPHPKERLRNRVKLIKTEKKPNEKIKELDKIEQVVCDYFNIKYAIIHINSRKREIVKYRQIVHFFSKGLTKYSLEKIGYYFGKRDHASVLNSIKSVNNEFETNINFRNDIENISKIFRQLKNND